MNILVTGSAGYVGSVLLKKLTNYRHTLYALDIKSPPQELATKAHHITQNSRRTLLDRVTHSFKRILQDWRKDKNQHKLRIATIYADRKRCLRCSICFILR